ncbi:LysR family transcriptional regulator [Celerinatantimonas sp. YJH-8]|uniref:LysR family transcriptional regulator n=1 Tax=Celerinatantimonas sp. YJH-8 TaxID=3228714 RepID=UPI0038C0B45E
MRHLKALYVFHVAAHYSSYSQAAMQLHITHGAVSKQIKQLEAYLGGVLFERQGRGIVLSPFGQRLRQYTEAAFEMLESGVHQLRQHPRTHLAVSCEPTLTMRWLMPRLGDFMQQSGIDVHLSTAGGAVTLDHEPIDMAIRRDDFEIPAHYQQDILVPEWVGPVFAPEYWQRVMNDVTVVRLLHSRTRESAWRDWLAHSPSELKAAQHHQYFDHFYFCLQAAMDGLGAAIGSYPLVADDLKQGRLVAPFGFILSGNHYLLLSSAASDDGASLALGRWLKQQLLDSGIPESEYRSISINGKC